MEMPARGKKCVGMQNLIKEGQEMMAEAEDDDTRDALMIAAAQKVEHYEIASYGTLRVWANLLGHSDAASLFEETLDEEKETDRAADRHRRELRQRGRCRTGRARTRKTSSTPRASARARGHPAARRAMGGAGSSRQQAADRSGSSAARGAADRAATPRSDLRIRRRTRRVRGVAGSIRLLRVPVPLQPPLHSQSADSSPDVAGKEICRGEVRKKAQDKVEKVMHERKHGTLRSGSSGRKVTSRKQAIAIGLSEARREGGKVPPRKTSGRKKSSARKKSSRKTSGRKKTSSRKKTSGRKTAGRKTSGRRKSR